MLFSFTVTQSRSRCTKGLKWGCVCWMCLTERKKKTTFFSTSFMCFFLIFFIFYHHQPPPQSLTCRGKHKQPNTVLAVSMWYLCSAGLLYVVIFLRGSASASVATCVDSVCNLSMCNYISSLQLVREGKPLLVKGHITSYSG